MTQIGQIHFAYTTNSISQNALLSSTPSPAGVFGYKVSPRSWQPGPGNRSPFSQGKETEEETIRLRWTTAWPCWENDSKSILQRNSIMCTTNGNISALWYAHATSCVDVVMHGERSRQPQTYIRIQKTGCFGWRNALIRYHWSRD